LTKGADRKEEKIMTLQKDVKQKDKQISDKEAQIMALQTRVEADQRASLKAKAEDSSVAEKRIQDLLSELSELRAVNERQLRELAHKNTAQSDAAKAAAAERRIRELTSEVLGDFMRWTYERSEQTMVFADLHGVIEKTMKINQRSRL